VKARSALRSAAVAACALAAAGDGAAAPRENDPVAIVEAASPGLELHPFDLAAAGRTAALGADGRLVLGYLKSCWQDSIVGGHVAVEPLQSRVEGGVLARRRVECDAAGLARMAEGFSARGGGSLAGAALPEPDVTLYGRSPIVISAQRGTLAIERLDEAAPALKFELEKGVDLREKGVALAARALYRFSVGQAAIVVAIDALAEPGAAPAVGRLVIFR
jgi:hypothetical protein